MYFHTECVKQFTEYKDDPVFCEHCIKKKENRGKVERLKQRAGQLSARAIEHTDLSSRVQADVSRPLCLACLHLYGIAALS